MTSWGRRPHLSRWSLILQLTQKIYKLIKISHFTCVIYLYIISPPKTFLKNRDDLNPCYTYYMSMLHAFKMHCTCYSTTPWIRIHIYWGRCKSIRSKPSINHSVPYYECSINFWRGNKEQWNTKTLNLSIENHPLWEKQEYHGSIQ
jgi:hypothetical protein